MQRWGCEASNGWLPAAMADGVDIEEARLRSRFRCYICSEERPHLLSVRLSRWYVGPPTFDMMDPVYELRVRFICPECFDRFEFKPSFTSGFLTHGERVFRMSNAKQPAIYDFRKWTAYVRRHGDAALT